jgi:hypothetical protein
MLSGKKNCEKWPEGPKMDLEVLLAVNALCFTSCGVKREKSLFQVCVWWF